MITRRYEVDNLTGVEINLGRVGENGTRTIEFDVRPWVAYYPDGFLMLYVVPPAPAHVHGCRPGMHHQSPSSNGYIAPTTYDDGIVSWEITSNDTQNEGKGAVELIMYGKNNEILQSTVVKTKVSRSLSHSGGCGCGPNPNQPWIDQVAHLAMAAQDAAERAEAAAGNVENIVVENYIPDGGEKDQVLAKLSDKDHDIGWVDMPSNGGPVTEQNREVINKDTRYDFPSVGDVNVIYKAEKEGTLYQWNSTSLKYEPLNKPEATIEEITIIHGGDAYGTA